MGQTLAPLGDDPYGEPNQLFRGTAPGRFEEVTPQAGQATAHIGTSRAAAFADYDNDGDVDVLIVNNGGRVELLRNDASTGNSLHLDLRTATGQVPVGARVRIHAAGTDRWRLVQRAYSYQASNDPRVHVGLGPATQADTIEVVTPSGRHLFPGPFAASETHRLRLD